MSPCSRARHRRHPGRNAEVTRGRSLSGVPVVGPEGRQRASRPADTAEGNRPLLSNCIGTCSDLQVTVILAGPNVNLIDASEENDGVYEIVLTEDTSDEGVGLGVYRGSVPIPEETSRLVAVTCSLSDNAGHTVSAAARSLPAEFAGSMEVTVASGYTGGARLCPALNSSLEPVSRRRGQTDGERDGEVCLEDMAPATIRADLNVQELRSAGHRDRLGWSGGPSPRPPRAGPATFWIHSSERRRGGPIELYSLQVKPPLTGLPLAQGTVQAASGVATSHTRLLVRSSRYSDSGPCQPDLLIPDSQALPERDSYWVLTLTLRCEPARDPKQLSGRVTAEQDPNSSCRTVSRLTRSSKALRTCRGQTIIGQYSLDLYEGPVRVVANHQLGMSKEIPLGEPPEPEKQGERLRLPISRPSPSREHKEDRRVEFAMDLDWRVVVHLNVRSTNLGTEANPKSAKPHTSIENGLVRSPTRTRRPILNSRRSRVQYDPGSVEVTLDEDCWARAGHPHREGTWCQNEGRSSNVQTPAKVCGAL